MKWLSWLLCCLLLSACGGNVYHRSEIRQLPSLDLVSIDNRPLIQGGRLQQPTLLLLFDNSCSHCVLAIEDLERHVLPIVEQTDLKVIGIGRDLSREQMRIWARLNRISFDLVADVNRQSFNQFADAGVPRLFLFDRAGKLVFQQLGWADGYARSLIQQIEALVASGE